MPRPEDVSWLVEFISEMSAVIVRSQLYVKDTSKQAYGDQSTDDWDYPRDRHVGGDDCEGFSAMILECVYMLRRGVFVDPVLRALQRIDSLYIPFFAVVAIALAPEGVNYTYHACVLKFDSRWVAASIGDPSIARTKLTYKQLPLLPAVVLESTTYTTSTLAYRDRACTPAGYQRSHVLRPIESMTKVPLRMLDNVYLHAVMCVSVELLESHLISRLEFRDAKGRVGVQFFSLLTYSPSVTTVPYYYATPAAIKAVDASFDHVPFLVAIRPPMSSSSSSGVVTYLTRVPLAVHASPPYVDMCYRTVDWEAVGDTIISQLHTIVPRENIEVVRLQLTSRASMIRIRAWK